MTYTALYRRYRSKQFDGIIGQNHITLSLKNQVKEGKISHAYLFTGSRGTGKTSTAKVFAKAVNCLQNADGNPCLICQNCISAENSMNILEMDAASNNRVDEIRTLRENVQFPPVNGKYKVYIIDEVHMLTDSAFNALLKTLEEPPPHAIFILATTEVHKLPQTIISRCLRYDFKLVGVEEMVKHLKTICKLEEVTFEEEALIAIASAGEGSVRDALSIADAVISFSNGNITLEKTLALLGQNDRETFIKFGNCVITRDIGEGLAQMDEIEKSGKNISVFAKDMTAYFRDLLIIKTCKDPNKILNLPAEFLAKYQHEAEIVTVKDLLFFIQVFSGIEAELRFTLSPRLLVETAFVHAVAGYL